jgi:hypothetical protein
MNGPFGKNALSEKLFNGKQNKHRSARSLSKRSKVNQGKRSRRNPLLGIQ